MKSITVEKKQSLFKRFINMITNSALFNIIADSSSGTYADEAPEMNDEYSKAFKKAYDNQKKSIESLSTLEEPEYNLTEDINPWKTKISESSELTTEAVTKGKSKKQKQTDRERND